MFENKYGNNWQEENGQSKIGSFLAFILIGIILIVSVVFLSNMHPTETKTTLSILNAIAAAIFCWFIYKPKYLFFKENKSGDDTKYIGDYWESLGLLNINDDDDSIEINGKSRNAIELAKSNEERVNKLVDQYRTHIFWFAFLLLALYLAFAVDNRDVLRENYDTLHPIMKIIEDILNFTNSYFIFLGFIVLYDKTLKDDNTEHRYKTKVRIFFGIVVAVYLIVSIFFLKYFDNSSKELLNEIARITNNPNYSKLLTENIDKFDENVKIAFDKEIDKTDEKRKEVKETEAEKIKNVAVKKKLIDDINKVIAGDRDDKNESNKQPVETEELRSKRIDSIKNLLVVYLKTNGTEADINEINDKIDAYRKKDLNKYYLNILQLIIGSLNGLSMALLFGRYVSMEHSLQNIDKGRFNRYLRWGIIIILPVYALAQPLFGSFEIEAFGPALNFQNIVFLICLIGKTLFFFVTWQYIQKRWMHYWLHLVLTKHSVPKDFYSCFETE